MKKETKEISNEELTALYFSTLEIKDLEERIEFFEKQITTGEIKELKIIRSNNPIIDSMH